MADEICGVNIEEKRRSRGRGRGILGKSIKDSENNTGQSAMLKEKEKYTEDLKFDKSDEISKQRGNKVYKTKAGYEPYQVKKSRSPNVPMNSDSTKSYSGERDSHSPYQNRNRYFWKNENRKTIENCQSYEYLKNQPNQNKTRPNNRKGNYRPYYKDKSKQPRHKKTDSAEQLHNKKYPSQERINSHDKTVKNADEQLFRKEQPHAHVESENIERELKRSLGILDNNILESVSKSDTLVNSCNYGSYPAKFECDKVSLAQDGENVTNIAVEIMVDTSEKDKLSANQLQMIEEIDMKRKAQGISILECPCSLNLNGDRVNYCDAHTLISEHTELFSNNTGVSNCHKQNSTNEWENADLAAAACHHHGDEVNTQSTTGDPIDARYLAVSPALAAEEHYSSEDELEKNCTNMKDELPSHSSIDIEDSLTPYLEKLSCNTNCSSFDNDIFYESSPSPTYISKNFSLKDINELFMNLPRRQSLSSHRSSSFGSKINSSSDKTWRSLEEFTIERSPTPKSPISVISISSDSSESNNSVSQHEKISDTDNFISKSCSSLYPNSPDNNEVALSKSYPSLKYDFSIVTSLSKNSEVPNAQDDSWLKNGVRRDSQDCYEASSNDLLLKTRTSDTNIEASEITVKSEDCIKKSARESLSRMKLEETEVRKHKCFMNSIVSILNENKTLDAQNKPRVDEQHGKKHFSYSSPNNEEEEKIMHQETKKSNETVKKSRSPKQMVEEGKLGNHLKSGIQSDVHHNNHNESKTAGMIILPKTNYLLSSLENTPSKQVSSYQLAGHRHVRFSPETSDLKVSIKQSAKLDSSYVIRDYMNFIKDKQFQLQRLLQKGFQSLNTVNEMLELSQAIQQKFGEIIVHNQEHSFRHNFENFLWKIGFHNIITKFRAFLEDQNVPLLEMQKIGDLYWTFLQNGIHFLDSIIIQLQEQANFDLSYYLDDPIKMSTCNKQVKFALRSCHLLLISMGDLERYISQLQQEESYMNAKKCYKEAQILAPRNGKSYNQLAVVAVVTKHKLDAVYYYARSLQVSIPFLNAKDRLTAIFQEISRKASKLKKMRNPYSAERPSNPNKFFHEANHIKPTNSDHLREEVWIFYRNGIMFKVMLTNDNEVVHLTRTGLVLKEENCHTSIGQLSREEYHEISKNHSKISLKEVNRGFMILFLFLHCKLYTNIGLEDFTNVHQETLSDLATLLHYPKTSSIRWENLFKCVVINIFSVHNIMEKNGHEDVIANTGLDLAIIFGMDMTGVLCKHCTHLYKSHEGLCVGDQFLPAIRVWLLWLITHSELVRKSTVNSMYDIWYECCEFFNSLISLPLSEDLNCNNEGSPNVYLEEDLLLAGLKSLNVTLMCCSPTKGEEAIVCSHFRIKNMIELIKRVDDCGNLPFAFDEKEGLYKPIQSSVIPTASPIKKVKSVDLASEIEALADVIIEDEEDFGDMSHVDELKAQKASLTKKIEESEDARLSAMKVLESYRQQGRHLSENSPTYVVADTNCYIDHLNHVAVILNSKDFTVIVPLIVINELDGLKKGSYFDEFKFHEHQQKVRDNARLAVDFLEDQFSCHDTNLRAITSNGTEMDNIMFRLEEFSNDRGCNDDIILSCCLKYCKEHKIRSQDGMNVVAREVVLLTSDRNLRLKAHSRVVPTIDILTFMKMAKFV